uniref:Ac17 n=1 Tax=Lymantria dispar multicapsid nuclear polyhedrosis virus TaxID=10449 RepID=A0A1B1MQY8_NPVLD|nr:hypothetical protein [Lymantria dispar multiple nucleopolyhedrovirus]
MLAQYANLLPVRVYINNVQTTASRLSVDLERNILIMHFYVSASTDGGKKVRVEIAPDRTTTTTTGRVQATFVQGAKHICIVNAKNASEALVFDGFPSAEDESQTSPFVLALMRSVAQRPDDEEDAGSVRTKARLMTNSNNLKVFVNEAIFNNRSASKWYHNLLGFSEKKSATEEADHFDDHHDDNDDNVHERDLCGRVSREQDRCSTLNNETRNTSVVNTSRWAPVNCRTGPFLFEAELQFTFVNNKGH